MAVINNSFLALLHLRGPRWFRLVMAGLGFTRVFRQGCSSRSAALAGEEPRQTITARRIRVSRHGAER